PRLVHIEQLRLHNLEFPQHFHGLEFGGNVIHLLIFLRRAVARLRRPWGVWVGRGRRLHDGEPASLPLRHRVAGVFQQQFERGGGLVLTGDRVGVDPLQLVRGVGNLGSRLPNEFLDRRGGGLRRDRELDRSGENGSEQREETEEVENDRIPRGENVGW